MEITSSPQILRVALPVPLPTLFDYLSGRDGHCAELGGRVLVPFGSRKLVGIVVEFDTRSDVPANRLLPIIDVLDQGEALLDKKLLGLLSWCWQYYKHAPGEVLQTALPPLLRKAKGALPEPPRQYVLTEKGRGRLAEKPGRAKAQYAMLKRTEPGPVKEDRLSESGPSWRKTLGKLLEQGWLNSEPAAIQQINPVVGHTLTSEQRIALDGFQKEAGRFQCHLLDGVTGSGKTEVYLHMLEQILTEGKQGLVLVPEIGLTPQLLHRFRQRLGLEPAVIHSRVSQGERLSAWNAARTGQARLLIGTRSALFTPLPELGLIILDEEHDASFKQQDGFRYSARDVAVKRAAELGVPVVLGSATPSLESINNADSGRYRRHWLRERATKAALPSWRVFDMSQNHSDHGLADNTIKAIAETLARKEQVMVFLNRRGWAPVLMCEQCGWHGECSRCESNLTWHRSEGRLRCHHCGSERRKPNLCPDCSADALSSAGEGTQQIERALELRFPETPVIRFDRDSTTKKGSFEGKVATVMEGESCILVGTQMLAKGHHFPDVTLVVVVNVDQALFSPDFRALERLGQTLLQVSGRAGREEKPGTVILQTFHPEDEALNLLISKGYEAFSNWLLDQRRQANLPPKSYQALLRSEAHSKQQLEQFLREAARLFPKGNSHVFGPMPAIKEKVGGRYRMYLMVQSPSRSSLHQQIDAWLAPVRALPSARKVRWTLDIDPQEL